MSTSAIGTSLDAIRAGLILRAGLSGVTVFTGPVPPEEAGLECIAFGDAELTEVGAAMGGLRAETWQVSGEIRVVKPWQNGGTETTIKAARDRDLAIFAELESYLNDTYSAGAYPDASLTEGEMRQIFNPDGRVCSLLFTFSVTAVKNP